MKILDFFESPEALDNFLAEMRKFKDFRMVVKPFGLAIFYNGKLQKTIKPFKK